MLNSNRRQEIPECNGKAGQTAERAVEARDYAAFEADFRIHHQRNDAERRGSYEQYRPVYRYGYDLGVDPRYRNADWPTVTDRASPVWEAHNPGTWEEFKDTIRYAWDLARGPR